MAATAKPYFGDVADMTYLQWLQRYVELAIRPTSWEPSDSPWLDITWRDRFAAMLQRAENDWTPATAAGSDTFRRRHSRGRRAA